MNRIKVRSMVVIACAVVMSLAGGSSWALCPSPPTGPICSARAGLYCSNADTTQCAVDADCPGGVCSAFIFGTPNPNGANVSSITTDSAHLLITTSGLNTPAASYRVHWDGFGSPFTGNVTVINANGSCTVPVRFSSRGDVAPVNEVICSDATYTFQVLTAPFWAAGQNACASQTYTCADGAPPLDSQPPFPLLDFPIPTTLYSIASPIHATPGQDDVVMEIDKVGTFDGHLRLVFARSIDHGVSYSAFTDATAKMEVGSTFTGATKQPALVKTVIIGTGEWSSVRAAVAVSPNNFDGGGVPTLGEWGMIIMSLLLLTASSVLLARRRPALAGSGPLGRAAPPLFVPRIYVRALTGTGALGIVVFAVLLLIGWSPSVTDIVGSLVCAGIVAYQIHLWTVQSNKSPGHLPGG